MTPEQAAERAADILTVAEHADNDRAIALVAVADGWTRLHAALANTPKPQPPTPASAEALKHELDEQRSQLAWLHGGYLNLGYWHGRAVCGGCMATIEHAEDVDAHYRLVPIEGINPAS